MVLPPSRTIPSRQKDELSPVQFSISLISSHTTNPTPHRPHSTNLCSNLLNTSHNSRGVGTTDSLDLLTTLEEKESRHGRDTVGSSDLRKLVDVDLEELDVGVLGAQLLDLGGDGLAGTAPLGEEVDQNGVVLDGLVELGVAG